MLELAGIVSPELSAHRRVNGSTDNVTSEPFGSVVATSGPFGWADGDSVAPASESARTLSAVKPLSQVSDTK